MTNGSDCCTEKYTLPSVIDGKRPAVMLGSDQEVDPRLESHR
jgi:hypothetical protein